MGLCIFLEIKEFIVVFVLIEILEVVGVGVLIYLRLLFLVIFVGELVVDVLGFEGLNNFCFFC